MNREQIIAAVRDVIAEAEEGGMNSFDVHAAVCEGANLLVLAEIESDEPGTRSERPPRPELDLHDANDHLREPLAENFAGLLEDFFNTSIRQHATNEAERPHVAYRLALGAVEAASRCVQQAVFECESSLPASEVDDAAINLFLVVSEIGEELDSRS